MLYHIEYIIGLGIPYTIYSDILFSVFNARIERAKYTYLIEVYFNVLPIGSIY